MKIRTAIDVLRVIRGRGLDVAISPGPPRMPVLILNQAHPSEATPALMEALKAWRVEIIEIIAKDEHAPDTR